METVEVYWQADHADLQATGRRPAALILPGDPRWGDLAQAGPKVQAAALLVMGERDLRPEHLTPRLAKHVHSEAVCRGFVWDEGSRLHLPEPAYRAARERVHGRDLDDFAWGDKKPVIWVDGQAVPYQQAIQEAISPTPGTATPAYRKVKRIEGFAFGKSEVDLFAEREAPRKVPSSPQKPTPAPSTLTKPSRVPGRKRT